MAVGLIAGLLGTAATAVVAWTVPKILDKISNYYSGSGKGTRQHQMQQGGGGAQPGGIKTTMLPGGDAIHQIEKHNPGFTKALTEKRGEVLKMLTERPEKWPGAQEFLSQTKDVFGDQQDEIPPFDFKPIAEEAMQRFQGEVIPGLAERFTAITGGGQRSGAFARQTTRAGERLTKGLAGLEAGMGREDAYRRAELGMSQRQQKLREAGFLSDIYGQGRRQQESWKDRMQKVLYGDVPSPYDTYTQPAQQQSPGFFAEAGRGFGQAAGKAAGTYGPQAVDWLINQYLPGALNTGTAT